MKSLELKVARIGNSRGVRIPVATLARYGVGDVVIMEERSDGILLRPPGHGQPKLSSEETAREMASAGEDWSAWETALADGLDEVLWKHARSHQVAEPEPSPKSRRRRR